MSGAYQLPLEDSVKRFFVRLQPSDHDVVTVVKVATNENTSVCGAACVCGVRTCRIIPRMRTSDSV